MVEAFIRHILGVGDTSPGIYGDTDAYYGMVEQQGRLTLHMHMLLWIKGCPSPQEIRDKLTSGDSNFQKALIEYLENAHTGDFLTGTMESVREKVYGKDINNSSDSYDPTLYVTSMPPEICKTENCAGCPLCPEADKWAESFKGEVDNIVLCSNVHSCRASSKGKNVDTTGRTNNSPKGCITSDGTCAARFPRDVHENTKVDPEDGHIDMQKQEPLINTYSPPLAALMRCNTDTTSLLSGTAVKAVISYVTDYVTKQALKTHQLFSTAYEVLQKQEAVAEDTSRPLNGARRTLLKIVNSLSTKLEIGSPMAAMYLLGQDDYYTSHKFVPFYWRSFVTKVRQDAAAQRTVTNDYPELELHLDENEEQNGLERVEIGQADQKFFVKSNVHDYVYRPSKFQNINLYNWVQGSTKNSRTKADVKIFKYLLRLFEGEHSITENFFADIGPGNVPEGLKGKSEQTLRITLRRMLKQAYEKDHPQFLTHYPTLNRERFHSIVPNFLGGGLPRSDEGDRDYYCSAMMTLFKPFRKGEDLIKADESWDNVFSNHEFSDRERELIRNFNLRYECLDARDDHSAQRKAANSLAFMSNLQHAGSYTVEELDERDSDLVKEAVDGGFYDDLWMPDEREIVRKTQEHEMDRILHSAGYFTTVTQTTEIDNSPNNKPAVNLSPAAWSNMVKSAKDAVLKSFRTLTNGKDEKDKLNGLPPTYEGAAAEQIRLLDATYFLNNYQARTRKAQAHIDKTVKKFALNEAQERAFRIIANHASSLAPKQLKLYMGGMAGTGKSTVVHALRRLFSERNEAGRYLIMAPTGSAAAQLNGSTYHSMLGIRDTSYDGGNRNEATLIRDARERFANVEYIIFDEISMLSCHDLYAISARLCQITNNHSEIFGGMNVVLLGDFAQLPPVGGSPLYNGSVSGQHTRPSVLHQENFLGRAIWHQFTTVVLLTENMRQKNQSERDDCFRTCLTNMRFASCTPQDIDFLKSMVISPTAAQSKSCVNTKLHSTAVITALNSQKDRINQLGVQKFAKDHNQKLHHFYSVDSIAAPKALKTGRKIKFFDVSNIAPSLQEKLWGLPPSASKEQVAARLSLCRGMPVMIRNNDATELCITKGQDGTVWGWDSASLPDGKETLRTLFIKLNKPPRDVKFTGLPKNVVPIPTALHGPLAIRTPSGEHLTVKRSQVPALPFFAMTDYASQGKTRITNVVDLGRSRNHQAVYTALSRSATAEGTAILQGFDHKKITCGISGHLRQEFRELEILNKMTQMRYDRLIPEEAISELRNPTLKAYYDMRKTRNDLNIHWHTSLHVLHDREPTISDSERALWDISQNNLERLRFAEKRELAKNNKARKRKAPHEEPSTTTNISASTTSHLSKKLKVKSPISLPHDTLLSSNPPHRNSHSSIIGPTWDSQNWSCAYDSVIFILYNAWLDKREIATNEWKGVSSYFDMLVDDFSTHTVDLNRIRTKLRTHFNKDNPTLFPLGPLGTDIQSVIENLLELTADSIVLTICEQCGHVKEMNHFNLSPFVLLNRPRPGYPASISGQLQNRMMKTCICSRCRLRGIRSSLTLPDFVTTIPPFLFIPMNYCVDIEDILPLTKYHLEYELKGVIYIGGNHFTARFIDSEKKIWHHDGMQGCNATIEECPPNFVNFIKFSRTKKPALAFYTRK